MTKIHIKFGNTTVQVEGENDKKLIKAASFWGALPSKCPLCSSEVGLYHKTTKKGDDYFGLRCKGETVHETNFGQHKQGETLYYKGEWKEMYGQGGEGDDEGPGY